MKAFEFWIQFHWSFFSYNIGSDNGLVLYKRQAIIWTNQPIRNDVRKSLLTHMDFNVDFIP